MPGLTVFICEEYAKHPAVTGTQNYD